MIAHTDRYEIEGIAEYTFQVVRNGFSNRLPWLLEVSPERLPRELFTVIHKVCDEVDLLKLHGAYPKHDFDDPIDSCTCLPLIKRFLMEYDWEDEHARLEWIDKCIEESASYSYYRVFVLGLSKCQSW